MSKTVITIGFLSRLVDAVDDGQDKLILGDWPQFTQLIADAKAKIDMEERKKKLPSTLCGDGDGE